MKIAHEVKKMIDEGWCIDCNGKLQMCIRSGCYGHSSDKEEVSEDAEESV